MSIKMFSREIKRNKTTKRLWLQVMDEGSRCSDCADTLEKIMPSLQAAPQKRGEGREPGCSWEGADKGQPAAR